MGNITGSASAEIDAPIEAVWDVVQDVATAPQWQDNMLEMRVLETDGEGHATVCESVNDASVKTVTSRLAFAYDAPSTLSWTQVKGDLKSLEGAWELEDLGGGRTKATYRIDGDPGRMLGMLIRGPVEGKIRDILVNARPAELKARVEGAEQGAQVPSGR